MRPQPRRLAIRPAPADTAAALRGGGRPGDVIETPRLILRQVDAVLARALYADRRQAGEMAGAVLHRDFPDPEVAEMLPGHATGLEADPARHGWGLWLLVYKTERMVVGGVGFKGSPNATGEVEIGYAVVRAQRRRGLAVEAVAALVAWAFCDSRVGRVLARCQADNVASVHVLERLGFTALGDGAANGAVAAGDTAAGPQPLRWHLTRGDWRRGQPAP